MDGRSDMGTATLFLQDEAKASELFTLVFHAVNADEGLVLSERTDFKRVPFFGTLVDAASRVAFLRQHARSIDASRPVQLLDDLLLSTGHCKPHMRMVRALSTEVCHLCMDDLAAFLVHLC